MKKKLIKQKIKKEYMCKKIRDRQNPEQIQLKIKWERKKHNDKHKRYSPRAFLKVRLRIR